MLIFENARLSDLLYDTPVLYTAAIFHFLAHLLASSELGLWSSKIGSIIQCSMVATTRTPQRWCLDTVSMAHQSTSYASAKSPYGLAPLCPFPDFLARLVRAETKRFCRLLNRSVSRCLAKAATRVITEWVPQQSLAFCESKLSDFATLILSQSASSTSGTTLPPTSSAVSSMSGDDRFCAPGFAGKFPLF